MKPRPFDHLGAMTNKLEKSSFLWEIMFYLQTVGYVPQFGASLKFILPLRNNTNKFFNPF